VCIVLAVVIAFVAIFTARPDQQDAKRDVGAAWQPLADDLNERYILLVAADNQMRDLPGPVSELADDVHTALQRWTRVKEQESVEPQVRAANTLEALGRRLVAAAQDSQRVQEHQEAKRAVEAFSDAPTPGQRVAAYNAAVRRYAQERRGPIRGVVATMLGHEDIPAFEPASV
jgi:hypothetical protein